MLLDGAPLAQRAPPRSPAGRGRLLAGSDLLPELLGRRRRGRRPRRLPRRRAVARRPAAPRLRGAVAGPARSRATGPRPRDELRDPAPPSVALAATIRARRGRRCSSSACGKPQQERWLDAWAADTGIRVGLAFGASAEFLVGEPDARARVGQEAGAEWLWRLGSDPKRLARRYLSRAPASTAASAATPTSDPPTSTGPGGQVPASAATTGATTSRNSSGNTW